MGSSSPPVGVPQATLGYDPADAVLEIAQAITRATSNEGGAGASVPTVTGRCTQSNKEDEHVYT